MYNRDTIEILRDSIARWVADAEATLQQAAHERREAVARFAQHQLARHAHQVARRLPAIVRILGKTGCDDAIQRVRDERPQRRDRRDSEALGDPGRA